MNSPTADHAALVPVREHVPGVFADLKYAGDDNFTGQTIYDFDEPYLRLGTALRLQAAQALLLRDGYALKIWDAWRPLSAQFKMWEVCPNDDYVADPTHGGSSKHNRGSAVDVTLVTADGAPLPMPTEFDDFQADPNRDYDKYPPEAAANARRLEQAMLAAGFVPYENEWWHYNDCDPYPVAENRLRTEPPELWDAVNQSGHPLGFDLVRGQAIPDGVYHHIVEIFTVTDRQNILVTQRHPDNPYGLLWEITGGSVCKGEALRPAAARELWEETGISAPPGQLVHLADLILPGTPAIYHAYAFQTPEDGLSIRLQPGETVDQRLLPWPEFQALAAEGNFFAAPFCRRFPSYAPALAALLRQKN